MTNDKNGFQLPSNMNVVGNRALRVMRLLELTSKEMWPESFFPPALVCGNKTTEYNRYKECKDHTVETPSLVAPESASGSTSSAPTHTQ